MAQFGRIFRSSDEQIEPVPGKISGQIPNWINGDFLTIGPALFDLGKDFTVNHWCDGFGMISKFNIDNGKVLFSKRYIISDAYLKGKAAGKPIFTEFGTKAYADPSKSILQKLVTNIKPELTDNNVTTLVQIGKTVYSSTETCMKKIINRETLESGAKVDVSSFLKLDLICAHMHFDADGTAYTIGTSLSLGFKRQLVKIPPNCQIDGEEFKTAEVLGTIPTSNKLSFTYSHSFGMSENYFVFVEQPLFIQGMKLLTAQAKGKSMTDVMEWKPEECNRFIVIHKSTGAVSPILYESEQPFFFFHHINTYEKDDELIVDLISHDSPEVIQKMLLKELRNSNFNLKDKAKARRFALPLINKIEDVAIGTNLIKTDTDVKAIRVDNKIKLFYKILAEGTVELPSINNHFCGKPYTYFYATGTYDQSVYKNSIVKVNTVNGEIICWKDSVTAYPGEPKFLPSPDSKSEDDGVLLINVTEANEQSFDYLLILNAKDLTEIARVTVTSHLPILLHGIFLPKAN